MLKRRPDALVAKVEGAINAELQDLQEWLDELMFTLADAFDDKPDELPYASRPDDDPVYRAAAMVIDAVWAEVADRGNAAGEREDAAL